MIFNNSLEYTFTHVTKEGDLILYNHYKVVSKLIKSTIPSTFPLTPEVLFRTHGVPYVDQQSMKASWHLEVPGMFMNHSCDPNVSAYPRLTNDAEDYAVRDIKKGEELTVDYCLQFYDCGPFFDNCECGSSMCRGSMKGFAALNDSEKERLFPLASDYVQAMHLAHLGRGLPIKHPAEIPHVMHAIYYTVDEQIPRLVFPGPSHALANVALKQDPITSDFGLYSLIDIKSGKKVYEFWYQTWPDKMPNLIDLVFAAPMNNSDPLEGTIIRINANKHALRDKSDRFVFSGWAMLTKHSCDPNLLYDNAARHEEEEWEWHSAYAAEDIKAGDQLTIDYNCMLWDRSRTMVKDACNCGAVNCTETMKGFKFLSTAAQEERMAMSWRRVSAALSRDERMPCSRGSVLSSHVREKLRKHRVEFVSDTGDSSRSSSTSLDGCSNSD